MMRAFAWVAARTWLFDLSGRLWRAFSPLLRDRSGGLRVPVWGRTRAFPAAPAQSFKQRWAACREGREEA